MNTKTIEVDPDFFRKRSGLSLKDDEIIKLLERARYNVTKKGKNLVCEYGSYRYDILHQVDVLEDMLISYGFNRIEPAEIKMPVKGFERKENKIDDIYRDICVGLGLQEVLTFTMTSREKQEQNIGLKDQQFVEIANFVSTNYQIFRRHLFPELLEFLAKNKNQQYPQRIFEIGKTLELDAKADNGTKEARKVSAIMSASKTNFTEIKSVLDAIANGRGFKYSLKESNLPFLEKGKAAEILANGKTIGFVGELNRGILANFSLGTNSTMLEIEVF
jgi:phenylalanyl-tRNA synthetase beta chain